MGGQKLGQTDLLILQRKYFAYNSTTNERLEIKDIETPDNRIIKASTEILVTICFSNLHTKVISK